MSNRTANGPDEHPAAAPPARRQGAAGRVTVLGRGLDALLGNLRTAAAPQDLPPEPHPEDDRAPKYQTQARRALLSRLQSPPPPPAAAAAPARTDFGRGFAQVMQAGTPTAAGSAAATGGESDENRVFRIEVERLEPNPYHGDARHDPDALRGLAQAVREQGLWQPLVVMPAPAAPGDPVARYWIISGERRWRAAIMVGHRVVPVLVRNVTPRAALQMALAEHTHHTQMSPLTRCRVYGMLTGDMGMSLEETATRVGVSVNDVATSLLVLQADGFVQESFDRGEISDNMAVRLMRAPAVAVRRELLRYAVRYRWDEKRLAKALHARGIEA